MKDYLLKLTKNKKAMMVIALLLVIIAIFIILQNYFYNNDNEMVFSNESSDDKWNSISSGSFAKRDGVIVVDVVGEVNNPGVVTLDEGARIIDAINAAGGKTDKADISEINLAYILDDGIRLYIPSFSEMKDKKLENKITNNQVKETISDGVGITNIVVESPTIEKNNVQSNKININKATLEELKQLPGVGESVAKAIVDYRSKNGKFNRIEDLKQVSGIGDSKFNNLKELVVVK